MATIVGHLGHDVSTDIVVGAAFIKKISGLGKKVKKVMILPVLTVSTLPYQVYGQTDVRTTEFLAVIDPR